MHPLRTFAWITLVLVSGTGRSEELTVQFGGKLQSDLRFRTGAQEVGDFYFKQALPAGVSRNENFLTLKLDAAYGDFNAVADVDFVWRGFPDRLEQVGDLTLAQQVDPYYLQVHGLYLAASDWLVDGLDLRIGQQLVLWGKADQFNPTNNLNPNDLEDILLFGDRLANFMVKADYTFLDQWTLSGVLVPVFKPALLPVSAPLAMAALDRLPFQEAALRYRVHYEKALAGSVDYPTIADRVKPVLPETSLENMQWSFRLAGVILEQDFAVSFYRGRSDLPLATHNTSVQETFPEPLCDPLDSSRCIDGWLKTDVELGYPRVDVVGINLAGEIPLDWIADSLQPLGYRLELGIYFPERLGMRIDQGAVTLAGQSRPAGEYDYGLGTLPGCDPAQGADCVRRPTILSDAVFAKWTVGLDYSIGSLLYINLMWVHGFPDDFGAGDFLQEGFVVRGGRVELEDNPIVCLTEEMILGHHTEAEALTRCGRRSAVEFLRPSIGDYAVVGLDLKFNDDKGLLRLFFIWDVSGIYEDRWDESTQTRVLKYLPLFGDGFSAIFYPEFKYNFGGGLELGLGAFLQFGKEYTKFGDPALGGSLIWTRARFSW